MRARDLAKPYPTVTMDTPAVDAARLLAEQRLTGLVVIDEQRRPRLVLPATRVLRCGVPGYARDDPALARVVDEAHADVFLQELGNRTLADCRPDRGAEQPVLKEDDTALEVAAMMARTRSPLVVIVDPAGRMIGVITLHDLLDRLLSR